MNLPPEPFPPLPSNATEAPAPRPRFTRADYGLAAGVALFVLLVGLLLAARTPGFFWHDDFQTYYLPVSREIARAWAEGSFPLLSNESWFCASLAGEFQNGIFSPFHTLLVLLAWKLPLTLPQTASFMALTYLVVLASGAVLLARGRGLSPDLAVVVALAATLNGWTIHWSASNWFSLLSSFAWLPWAWLALERALTTWRGPYRFVPAALALGLLITAGWPMTILMAGFVTLWLVLRHAVSTRAPWSLWPAVAAWAAALGLSAPAWLLFVDYGRHTERATTALTSLNEWSVPLAGLSGLLLPTSTTVWNVYMLQSLHPSVELACGVVPAIALLVWLVRCRAQALRPLRWELGLLAFALLLCLTPSLTGLRWSFRWLPFFHLLLALTGAQALALLRQHEAATGKPLSLGAWAAAGIFGCTLVFSPAGGGHPLSWTYLALAGVWAVVEAKRTALPRLAPWMPAAMTALFLVGMHLSLPNAISVPVWPVGEAVRQPAPYETQRRYLALALGPDYFDPQVFRRETGPLSRLGNLGMLSGIEFVNGYSPLRPAGMQSFFQFALHGYLQEPIARHLATRESAPLGMLQLMGVDGLLVSPLLKDVEPALQQHGWRPVARGVEGALYHRTGPASPRAWSIGQAWLSTSPRDIRDALGARSTPAVPVFLDTRSPSEHHALRAYAPARLALREDARLHMAVDVQTPPGERPSLVVFSRPFIPGYRVRLDGRELPVRVANLFLPAVEVPAGVQGTLRLEYRPLALEWGLAVSAASLLLIALLPAWALRRRRAPAPALGA